MDLQKNQIMNLESERGQMVVKSNNMIQKTRFSLSVQEQKMILFLISKIQPNDTVFQEYTFTLRELCDIMGISYNGKNYRDFRNSIQSLADKSFWVDSEDGASLCRWIEKARVGHDLTVTIRLDDDLKPYLLELYEHFTSYELEYILTMRSKYSIRMYELFKSYSNCGTFEISIVELKQLLLTPEYKAYKDFRVRVIDPAVREINQFTDLEVFYAPRRTGRMISHLRFTVDTKSTKDKINSMMERKMILNKSMH